MPHCTMELRQADGAGVLVDSSFPVLGLVDLAVHLDAAGGKLHANGVRPL